MVSDMDIQDILILDTTWSFTGELLLRCVLMYIMIIVVLRLTGKRGVRQLSIFEVAIILCLGSIAGDPMFTEDLPLIQALVVMSTIMILYRVTTWLMMKYQPFEDLLEGKSAYIVENGQLVIEEIQKGKMSHDEFFAEMRQQSVEHLGQVRIGLLESDGKFSILYYADDQVKYGLPLFPKACELVKYVDPHKYYACRYCGNVTQLDSIQTQCIRCQCCEWAEAINCKRIT